MKVGEGWWRLKVFWCPKAQNSKRRLYYSLPNEAAAYAHFSQVRESNARANFSEGNEKFHAFQICHDQPMFSDFPKLKLSLFLLHGNREQYYGYPWLHYLWQWWKQWWVLTVKNVLICAGLRSEKLSVEKLLKHFPTLKPSHLLNFTYISHASNFVRPHYYTCDNDESNWDFNRVNSTNLRWAEEWETFSWKITETFLDLKPAQLIDFTYIVTHEQFH